MMWFGVMKGELAISRTLHRGESNQLTELPLAGNMVNHLLGESSITSAEAEEMPSSVLQRLAGQLVPLLGVAQNLTNVLTSAGSLGEFLKFFDVPGG